MNKIFDGIKKILELSTSNKYSVLIIWLITIMGESYVIYLIGSSISKVYESNTIATRIIYCSMFGLILLLIIITYLILYKLEKKSNLTSAIQVAALCYKRNGCPFIRN